MNFVVIGSDHRAQQSDPGLEGVIRPWLDRQYSEPLKAIAEEYAEKIGNSIGHRLAQERRLLWYNIALTSAEEAKAGILEEQHNRPETQGNIAFRVLSDDLREDGWIEKLTSQGSGTVLVICGYLHFESLVRKLRERGHSVDQRVYLEKVPEIRLWIGRLERG
jgi:hypothetical protein